jgi:hypothetical protein
VESNVLTRATCRTARGCEPLCLSHHGGIQAPFHAPDQLTDPGQITKVFVGQVRFVQFVQCHLEKRRSIQSAAERPTALNTALHSFTPLPRLP